MTDDNSNPVDMDNLDEFENVFFGREAEEPEVQEEEAEDENEEEDVDENEDDNPLADEDDDDSEDEDEDEEPEPQPKQKRSRAQERIEKLVAEARQAERERDALRRELEALRAPKEEKHEEEVPLKDKLPSGAPTPDAVNDKGEPVYPLGEFDPQYIADLTRFTITQEMEATRKAQEQEMRKREAAAAQEALKETWQENLERAEESLPDLRERISTMAEAFEGIEPAYGEYLAGTIMSCEYGPEIMYYLSQNIGEAQKIVASGPAAATLAIGRLEAQFINSTKQEDVKRNNKRMSDAPIPPEQRSRGTHGRFNVRPDTDDLDAFEREFFKKPNR